ncbi:MAG: hypothetical protein H0T44_03070 [Gemmatimonadales bacterium]|nr:hypothetical protein [Gemmatimonadales bacterium]
MADNLRLLGHRKKAEVRAPGKRPPAFKTMHTISIPEAIMPLRKGTPVIEIDTLEKLVSHCGVDAFQIAKSGGAWRIIGLTDTRRSEGCPGQGAER